MAYGSAYLKLILLIFYIQVIAKVKGFIKIGIRRSSDYLFK